MDNIILKNWSVTSNPWEAPEIRENFLQGDAYGHPKFPNDSNIKTSAIVFIEDKGGCKLVTTRTGHIYESHKENVDPECERLFPGYYDGLKIIEGR